MEIKLVKGLRIKIGSKLMEHKALQIKRKVKAVNLKKASSVGIVFDANNEINLKHIKELVSSFTSTGAKVEVIGYIQGKKKEFSYIGDKTYSFISDEDFNFLMQPISESISHFLSWQPEILLILCQNYHFPVHYIAKLSKAGLKVGQSGLYDEIGRAHV